MCSCFDTYGDTVADIATAVAGSSVSGLLKDDDDWNLGDTRLYKNADERTILLADFTIQTQ